MYGSNAVQRISKGERLSYTDDAKRNRGSKKNVIRGARRTKENSRDWSDK